MLLLSCLYYISICILSLYGLHRLCLVVELLFLVKKGKEENRVNISVEDLPLVCVQIPLYNELAVASRVLHQVAQLDYPAAQLEIQILDDSNDETKSLVDTFLQSSVAKDKNFNLIRRSDRSGFKAGALKNGMSQTKADLIAIFDADFLPPEDFLKKTVSHFQDPAVGFVQTRWGHLNRKANILTRAQAVLLDAHFCIEHQVRYLTGACFNFNGTAGLWRRKAIDDAGGWQGDTLTEDLDLSYRSYLAGWKGCYLVDVVSPAELPEDLSSYKSQQYRWSKGTAQVLKKLFIKILLSRISLRAKIEAFFHLTAHVCYLLLVFVTVTTVPVSLWRRASEQPIGLWFEAVIFLCTIVSLLLFFALSQRKDKQGSFYDVFLALLVGVGMSAHCSKAMLAGLFSNVGVFERTPKKGSLAAQNNRNGFLRSSMKIFNHRKETILFIYLSLGLTILFLTATYLALPFLFLLYLGYFIVLQSGVREQ